MMNPGDTAIFQQAIQLANSGQIGAAYAQFTDLLRRGNQGNPELLLWIAFTTSHQAEAQRMLDTVATLAPNHPSLPAARQNYAQRYQIQQYIVGAGVGPALHCPYCRTYAATYIQKRISTAGWITFGVLLLVFLPLFWIGLLIKEDVYVCSGCGIKLGSRS
ncbi:MAG TPA: LITAF-like zinc ribbon domain-containing protein [Ktedonobacteraceae bacterium]|nr:LITAF-like zinc ribbon domain-containing protein [Ktedonobacteraceae bacterium]